MATQKDFQLVDRLIRDTGEGRLSWEPTATNARYATSLKGKFTVTIDQSYPEDRYEYWLALGDSAGQELVRITDTDYDPVRELFELVRRRVLRVDEAIDEILHDD